MTHTSRGSFSDNKHAAVSPLHFAAVRDQNLLAVMWDHTRLWPAHTQKKKVNLIFNKKNAQKP